MKRMREKTKLVWLWLISGPVVATAIQQGSNVEEEKLQALQSAMAAIGTVIIDRTALDVELRVEEVLPELPQLDACCVVAIISHEIAPS